MRHKPDLKYCLFIKCSVNIYMNYFVIYKLHIMCRALHRLCTMSNPNKMHSYHSETCSLGASVLLRAKYHLKCYLRNAWINILPHLRPFPTVYCSCQSMQWFWRQGCSKYSVSVPIKGMHWNQSTFLKFALNSKDFFTFAF